MLQTWIKIISDKKLNEYNGQVKTITFNHGIWYNNDDKIILHNCIRKRHKIDIQNKPQKINLGCSFASACSNNQLTFYPCTVW